MRQYKPEIIEDHRKADNTGRAYVAFACELEQCTTCGKLMMPLLDTFDKSRRVFPYGFDHNQEAQMKAAGIVPYGKATLNDDWRAHCQECVDAGRITFKCYICGQQRGSDLLYGADSHYGERLCTVCYGTLTAKEWRAKLDEIEEAHRYDY